MQRDGGRAFASPREHFETSESALASEKVDLFEGADLPKGFGAEDLGRVLLRATSTDPGQEIFIGIGPRDEIDKYFTDVARTRGDRGAVRSVPTDLSADSRHTTGSIAWGTSCSGPSPPRVPGAAGGALGAPAGCVDGRRDECGRGTRGVRRHSGRGTPHVRRTARSECPDRRSRLSAHRNPVDRGGSNRSGSARSAATASPRTETQPTARSPAASPRHRFHGPCIPLVSWVNSTPRCRDGCGW